MKHHTLQGSTSAPIDYQLLAKEVPEWERSTSMVVSDMLKREAFGLAKYGKYLHKYTDEDMLQHLYEELLDAAVYIKTLIEQRNDNTNTTRT